MKGERRDMVTAWGRAVLATAVVAGLLSACAPASEVRRSALVPAASLPGRVGEPLGEGQFRGVFEVGAVEIGDSDPLDVDDLFVDIGTAGVFVPNFHLGGSAYFGVSENLEIGARLQYTNVDWADANVIGVLPFPSAEDGGLWSIGPGIRANFPLGEGSLPIWLSLLGELNYTSVPQAVYVCSNCADGPTGELPFYELHSFEHESFWLPNVAMLLGAYPSDFAYVGFIFGGQSTVTNTGFDNDLATLDDSTLETVFVGYAGLGADFIFEPLVAGVWGYVPFGGDEDIDFGVRATFQVGVTFGGGE